MAPFHFHGYYIEVSAVNPEKTNLTFPQMLLVCALSVIEDLIPVITLNLCRPKFAASTLLQLEANNEQAEHEKTEK